VVWKVEVSKVYIVVDSSRLDESLERSCCCGAAGWSQGTSFGDD